MRKTTPPIRAFFRAAVVATSLAASVLTIPASVTTTALEGTDLIGHWKLDEGAGGIAVDASGFGRDGVISGGTHVDVGLAQIPSNPFALNLDGAGGHVAIPDSSDWSLTPSNSLTISLWVTLLQDRGVFHVFGKRQGCDGAKGFYQLARDGRGFFFMTNGGVAIANRPLEPGLLTHVAVTYDAGQVRLYMDGVLAGSAVAPMSTTPPGPLLVGTSGSCGGNQSFPGIVDDIRVYRRALTGVEVAHLGAREGVVYVPVRPELTWTVTNVSTILDEQALSATASVAGTFTYTPSLGSVLPIGPATLYSHFEPEDPLQYQSVDVAIQVMVVVEFAVPVDRVAVSTYMPLAVDEARNLMYISTVYRGETALETLLVIEGNTHTVIDRIAFTKDGEVTPAMGVALDPQRNRLYVITSDTRVWVLDATTHQISEIIEVPASAFNYPGAYGIAVNPTTGLVYLPLPERLVVVDPFKPASDPDRVSVVPLTPGYNCIGIAINPVHNLVYSGGQQDEGNCPLIVVDGDPARETFNTVIRVLPDREDQLTRAFAVDPRNGNAYVVAWNWPETHLLRVLVVDGDPGRESFHTVTNEIEVDLRWAGHATYDWIPVFGLALNPNSNRLYVQTSDPRGDGGGYSLAIFDTATTQLASLRRLPFQHYQNYGSEPAVNAVTNRVYVGDGQSEILVLEDPAADPIATEPSAPGEPVLITANHASLTFAAVTAAGATQVVPVAASSLNVTVPGAYSIDGGQAYEVTTTASVVAPITLCFNAWHVNDPGAFAALRVMHGENGALVDRTSSHDFATRTICATVDSLSPFVIARYTEPTYGVMTLYDTQRAFKSGSTAPIRLQISDSNGVNLSSASLTLHAVELRQTSTSATQVIAAGQSNADQNFRFDPYLGGGGGYIFNLKTTGLATGSYELRFVVGSGQRQYVVPVQVR